MSLGLKRKPTCRIPIRDRSVDRNAYNVLLDGVENRYWLMVLNKPFFVIEVYSDEDDVWDDEGRSYHKNIMANEDDAFYWLW